jgi:glycerol 2-dehydrogenase (NADP+)
MTSVPSFTLNTGAKMPAVGMGCWIGEVGGGERVYKMCMASLEVSRCFCHV